MTHGKPAVVFVVWDMSNPNIGINLEVLAQRPPRGFEIRVPGLRDDAGSILQNVVVPGIQQADRVLVLTDQPNANVGFEAGLALGFGKPILLAFRGSELPDWASEPPLRNYLQHRWSTVDQLRQLVEGAQWYQQEPAPPLPQRGFCLDLCPDRGTGSALREVRDRLRLDGWLRPDDVDAALTVGALNATFENANRLVWTVTDYDAAADMRDGAANASNAVIAGWFYSRCDTAPESNQPFWVLRLPGQRRIVDVELHAEDVNGVADYEALIARIEQHGGGAGVSVPSMPVDEGGRLRIAVPPFENLSSHAQGAAFSWGLTNQLVAALDRLPVVESVSPDRLCGEDLSSRGAAEKLGITYVVRGSLKQQGDYCLIDVRIVRVGVDTSMLSYRRRYRWDDVLNYKFVVDVVRDVSRGISSAMAPDISFPDRDPKATELYWRALEQLRTYNNSRDPAVARAARELFSQVLIRDGSYEEARVTLGFLDLIRWETEGDDRLLRDSQDIWRNALRENPVHPVARAETGYVDFVLGEDRLSAINHVFAAVEGKPDDALANNVLALLYLYLGYYEAAVELETKRVIPEDPAYVYPYANVALALELVGDHERALEWANRAADVDPRAFVAAIRRGSQHFYLGDLERANEVWRVGQDQSPDGIRPIFDVLLAWILINKGNSATSATVLSAQTDSPWIHGAYGAYYISLCALYGDHARALDLLRKERTYASSYRYLASEPNLRPLYGNPAFLMLLEQRYHEWLTILDVLRERLPVQPPELPNPADVLRGASPPFDGGDTR